MTSKIFISGISGFIGTALAKRLSEKGMEVSGISRSGGSPGVISGDVLDCRQYGQRLGESDIVIHMAAPTSAAEINGQPLTAMKTNLMGTHAMLQAFSEGKGRHFIFLSTGKVYGRQKSLPLTEDLQPNPEIPLGQSKRLSELVVEFYALHTQKSYSIIRLFNTYGPGQRPGFLVPTILEQLRQPEVRLGDTRGKRDFVYLDDVVNGIETLMDRQSDGGCGTYNLGSGLSHSPADILSIMEGVLGRSLNVVVDPARMRTGEPDEERAGIEKLKSLGWSPQTDLKTGLAATLEAMNVAAR